MKQEEMLQNKQGLSPKEITILVQLINKCEPGNLPSEVFESIAKIAVYPAVEVTVFRNNNNELEVLLTKRSDDDPVWPGMYHLPGTVLRPTDNSIDNALNRLYVDELDGLKFSNLQFTGVFFNKYIRGQSIGLEYRLDVLDDTTVGDFFNVEKLPSNFISEQKAILERAVKARNLH